MHTESTDLVGPDFIGQLADRQLHAGLEIDYSALRNNQQAWAADRAKLDQQDATIVRQGDELQALRAKLESIGQAANEAAIAKAG